jgi:hypothetical protein
MIFAYYNQDKLAKNIHDKTKLGFLIFNLN